MLNISENSVNKNVSLSGYKAYKKAFNKSHYKMFNRLLKIFAVICVVVLFLPWTQNITSSGTVTTLKPDHRPQTIQSVIPGRIEKWYVQEGDFVKKGDTILHISEIKNEYLDPRLVERTNEQIKAKSSSVTSYQSKISALNNQVEALLAEKNLKIQQGKLKVISDSTDLVAERNNLIIAKTQLERVETLANEGLKATKDVEEKRLKLQEVQAKVIAQENKYLNSKVELNRIEAEYADKISKSQSDKFSAQSNQFDTEAQVSKLENANSNYQLRNAMYYVTAPQSGYINKAIKAGIGETFKEGEQLVGIMPSDYEVALETYVDPIDLPLVHLGETFRVQFDGWPAIVFSGWPNVSYGTYGAKVVAIENFISPNGKFRVLLAPDKDDHDWPEAIRVGSGARTIGLLDDVPIWFELWRQLNSFPPNYYQPEGSTSKEKK
ncbi:HlyD family secretion protein [Aurantibacter aestuarii]|uniref:Biotin attachment protein n=1 Tax=Aurantibacter aestuarii TaxID=1266046 RepID=A0A2T1N8F6_9FLAO|nr:biotin/lipoyl-binding protein [Aurantibacter aestuarii]PSG88159.1 biotin attachment protein [Aurantibacter aestuarii]